MPLHTENGRSAEREFRNAFERLKAHKPERLSTSAPVTQNNVAKEAGCDPSALKKSRYPGLIVEIQIWVAQHGADKPPSPRQKVMAQRKKNKSLREQLITSKAIRDIALSKLADAEAQIIDLTMEVVRLNEQLPPSNVLPMRERPRST
jgi:hypothetical protein